MKLNKIFQTSLLFISLISAPAALSQSELTAAVMSNNESLVSNLIDQNVNVNNIEVDGSTALHWAVYNESQSMVSALIAAGADANAGNREGMTPLVLSAVAGNAPITKRLLDAGASVNQTLAGGETPLMMAARTGDLDTIQIMLDRGARIEDKEALRGTNALMWAAAYKNAEALQLLLDNGAQISSTSATTSPGRNPYLAQSARTRLREFFRGRGQGGGFIAEEDNDEAAPEVEETREEMLARLPEELAQEFAAEEIEIESNTPVAQAPRKQWGGLTALHFAVREGDLESVKVLIEAGADVNQLSEYGWTPLLTATQNRYYELGTYLLEQGANPNIVNEGGWSPLYIASDNRNIEGGDYPTRKPDMNHLDYIKSLLAAGANPNRRMQSSTETRTIFTHQWLNENGATPFLRAAQSSDVELMKLLLAYDADPNINTLEGVTPLMLASGIAWVEGVTYEWSEDANKEAIKMLLELGNDPNYQDIEDNRTAMMGAGHKGRGYAIEMLVAAGGDLSLQDIGSRDSLHKLAGTRWQAVDYANGLVRIGVQSPMVHPETEALIIKLMLEQGLDVPIAGRTLDSICIVDLCK